MLFPDIRMMFPDIRIPPLFLLLKLYFIVNINYLFIFFAMSLQNKKKHTKIKFCECFYFFFIKKKKIIFAEKIAKYCDFPPTHRSLLLAAPLPLSVGGAEPRRFCVRIYFPDYFPDFFSQNVINSISSITTSQWFKLQENVY